MITRPKSIVVNAITDKPSKSAVAWHQCLGHASNKMVKTFLECFVDPDLKKNWEEFFCEQCVISKGTSHCFLPKSSIPKDVILDLMVSDVMGPFKKDVHGNQYLLTLHDHFSMYTWVAPLKLKLDVANQISIWFEMHKTCLHQYPKYLCSANGGEFILAKLSTFL